MLVVATVVVVVAIVKTPADPMAGLPAVVDGANQAAPDPVVPPRPSDTSHIDEVAMPFAADLPVDSATGRIVLAVDVLDENWEPVGDAPVFVWDAEPPSWAADSARLAIATEVHTDAAGHAKVLLAGVDSILLAETDDGRTSGLWRATRLREAPATGVVLVLHPQARVSGRVAEANGDPVPGARVTFHVSRTHGADPEGSEPRPLEPVLTDARGRFEARVDTPSALSVEAEFGGRRTLPAPILDTLFPDPHVELRFAGAFAVTGRVTTESPHDFSEASIRVEGPRTDSGTVAPPPEGAEPVILRGSAEADGAFMVPVPFVGEYAVHVDAPGLIDVRRSWVTVDHAHPRPAVELPMLVSAHIRGRAVRDDGTPVAGVKLLAHSHAVPRHVGAFSGNMAILAAAMSRTDADGRFDLHGLQPGEFYRISTSRGSGWWTLAPQERVAAGTGNVDVLLEPDPERPTWDMKGFVVDDEADDPIELFAAGVDSTAGGFFFDNSVLGDWGDGLRWVRDPRGAFTFPGVERDIVHRLVIRAPGFAPAVVRVHDGGPPVVVRLSRPGAAQVTVVDEGGRPVPAVAVVLHGLDLTDVAAGTHRLEVTDETGRVEFRALPPGAYRADVDGQTRLGSAERFDVRPGETTSARVRTILMDASPPPNSPAYAPLPDGDR